MSETSSVILEVVALNGKSAERRTSFLPQCIPSFSRLSASIKFETHDDEATIWKNTDHGGSTGADALKQLLLCQHQVFADVSNDLSLMSDNERGTSSCRPWGKPAVAMFIPSTWSRGVGRYIGKGWTCTESSEIHPLKTFYYCSTASVPH